MLREYLCTPRRQRVVRRLTRSEPSSKSDSADCGGNEVAHELPKTAVNPLKRCSPASP